MRHFIGSCHKEATIFLNAIVKLVIDFFPPGNTWSKLDLVIGFFEFIHMVLGCSVLIMRFRYGAKFRN